VRINADPKDAFYTAFQIAELAKSKGFDLILTGKETINYNGSQIGGMIAELLSLPYVSLSSKLEVTGGKAKISREITGGIEVLEVATPFVLSAAKGMAEQRIPNMRGIMAARTKPLLVLEPAQCSELVTYESYELPLVKTECRYVDAGQMSELVKLLHQEAKVI